MGSKRPAGIAVVAAALIVVVVLVATGYVSWNRWWRKAGPANPGFTCSRVVPAQHRVPLAAGGVHRVALIGDSIMDNASCAIAESLSGVGIETSRHAVGGSGLLVGMDWVSETRKILRKEHPDVVVAIFVGNFLVFGVPPDSAITRIKDGSPEFYRRWQARARQLSAEVHAAGAQMYWVSPPPIEAPPLSHAARLYAGYQKIPGDHFLDSGEVLAGPDDKEVRTKETCGRRRVIRTPEGVHLTPDGARIYGQQIAHDLTAQLGLVTTPKPC
jgi:hypothetical protein